MNTFEKFAALVNGDNDKEVRSIVELNGKQAHISYFEPVNTKYGSTYVFELVEAPEYRYFASGAVKTFLARCERANLANELSTVLLQFDSAVSKSGNSYMVVNVVPDVQDPAAYVTEPSF